MNQEGERGGSAKPLPGASRPGTYYNEWDPFAAQWLRNLMAAGHISEGVVDGRSIKDVQSGDIPSRAHFFAGIGGWEIALQLAGWPAERPVWTGSCPCQPFSASGKKLGEADPRHLWPEMRRLIEEREPPTIFGEQVASKDGRLWLSGVRADLEALGYQVGAADLCAAGLGAPHIRQRLFWVAHAENAHGRGGERGQETGAGAASVRGRGLGIGGAPVRMADTDSDGLDWRPEVPAGPRGSDQGQADNDRDAGRMGNAEGGGCGIGGDASWPGGSGYAIGSSWAGFDVTYCRDDRSRRIESGALPLAYGIPRRLGQGKSGLEGLAKPASRNRTGRLKGYGNAIVPALAAEFIRAFLEASPASPGAEGDRNKPESPNPIPPSPTPTERKP